MGGLFGGGAKQAYANNLVALQGVQQSAAANKDAAIAGTEMSLINQKTPYGSLTYTQRGKSDAGNPLWESETTFDPVTQQTLDTSKALDLKTNQFALDQANRAASALGSNVDFSEGAIGSKVASMINPRLADRFGREEGKLQTGLINRGIREGSEQWNDAMRSFGETKNDAYTQEALANRQQALQEIPLGRNQILNEINALNGMQQIQGPQFVSTPRTNVTPADWSQYTNQVISGNNAMAAQKKANAGGIAGLVGQGLQLGVQGAALLSDERAKTDMKKVGELDNGEKVYAYRYFGGGPMQIGLKAQDVEKSTPEAVSEGPDGLKRVNYALAVARKRQGKERRDVA